MEGLHLRGLGPGLGLKVRVPKGMVPRIGFQPHARAREKEREGKGSSMVKDQKARTLWSGLPSHLKGIGPDSIRVM